MTDQEILKILLKKNKTLTQYQQNLLSEIIQLLRRCPSSHKKYDVAQIQSWIVNPLLKENLLVLEKGGKTVAITTFAAINKNVARKWFTDKKLSDLDDWNSGNDIWWIDCLAPEGNAREICRMLRNHLRAKGLRKKYINHIRVYKNGDFRINKSML